ncbi:TSC22 domain family protein 3 [Platysternon megacephalum]|uniref:TSC22 domain family protein 3 n=1 Tax=Platysternon megacephalum TaxID=55544 RepID=A0A4D9DL79_9SAUR|nr:TSC22 domain family protein 3 [Platysternon megacephalum]
MGGILTSQVDLKKLENEEAEKKRQHEKEEKQRQREEEEKKRQHEDRERERQHKERMHQRELEDKAKEREARCQMQEREYEEQEKKRKHEEIITQLQNRNLELRILRLTGLSSSKNSPQRNPLQDMLSSITRPTMPDAVENGDDSSDDDVDILNPSEWRDSQL